MIEVPGDDRVVVGLGDRELAHAEPGVGCQSRSVVSDRARAQAAAAANDDALNTMTPVAMYTASSMVQPDERGQSADQHVLPERPQPGYGARPARASTVARRDRGAGPPRGIFARTRGFDDPRSGGIEPVAPLDRGCERVARPGPEPAVRVLARGSAGAACACVILCDYGRLSSFLDD